jgi:hypothetical protein
MEALLQSFVELLLAVWQLLLALVAVVLPWTPLLAWVAFWSLAVDWVKLRLVMIRGGWIAVVLIALVATLVWGMVDPPMEGSHYLLGKTVGNFVGKFMYVTGLTVIMLVCGSVQLAGGCGKWAYFPEDAVEDEHGDAHSTAHAH